MSHILLSYVSFDELINLLDNILFFLNIRFGADIRSLNVMLQTSNANVTLFTRNGTQGNVWRKGQVDFESTISYKVIFEGVGKYID